MLLQSEEMPPLGPYVHVKMDIGTLLSLHFPICQVPKSLSTVISLQTRGPGLTPVCSHSGSRVFIPHRDLDRTAVQSPVLLALTSWPGRGPGADHKARDQMDKLSERHIYGKNNGYGWMPQGAATCVLSACLLLPMGTWAQWCPNFSFLPSRTQKS